MVVWHVVWIVVVVALLIGAIAAMVRMVRRHLLGRDPMRNELNRIDSRLSSIESTLKDVNAE